MQKLMSVFSCDLVNNVSTVRSYVKLSVNNMHIIKKIH